VPTQLVNADLEVALVIRNDMNRYGLEGMIRTLDRITATHSFKSGDEAALAAKERHIDLILASSTELGCDEARAAIEDLCDRGARLLILVDDADSVESSSAVLAHGFVDWSELGRETLADAMDDVMAGRFHVSATLARRLLAAAAEPPAGGDGRRATGAALTPRELQVLRHIAEGLSNKQVARELGISEHGVKRLVGNMLAKLNCPNRTLAVVRAIEAGLLTL
jgi:DNA-binding NarL/FixJ family response regulator